MDSYRPGPGTLTLGTGMDELEFNLQVTNVRIEPTENVDEGDDLDTLDGEHHEGLDNVSYSFVLAGTIVQDLNDTGVTAWSWANMGEEVAFEFVPVTARVASVTGTVRVVPLQIGGDVKVRNTADFSWAITGDAPVFTPQDTTP